VGEPGAAVESEGGVGARGEERGRVRRSRHGDAGEVWVWEAAVIAGEEAGVGVAATVKWAMSARNEEIMEPTRVRHEGDILTRYLGTVRAYWDNGLG